AGSELESEVWRAISDRGVFVVSRFPNDRRIYVATSRAKHPSSHVPPFGEYMRPIPLVKASLPHH
ncbi:MAG TPA: hypothetical protein VIV60_26770, partial [Polyangiaceae bacterium]